MVRILVIIAAVSALVLMAAYLWIFNMPDGERSTARSQPPDTRSLQRHIHMLANSIGERHPGKIENLNHAADYIAHQFTQAGLRVSDHVYNAQGQRFRNVIAEVSGENDELIVIGAHYDSIPGSPAANDNGSGVAALLQLAALVGRENFKRSIRYIAFANEERPYNDTDAMGSLVYARFLNQSRTNVVAMISLETIGYYTDAPGSQYYPPPLSWFYPDQGNFVAFIGNLRSRRLVRTAIASFRSHARIASEGIAAPELLRDIRRSDQASFWQFGYPALMVTDTAPYRYPYYHSPEDTFEKIDFPRLAQVVEGMVFVIRDLAIPRP